MTTKHLRGPGQPIYVGPLHPADRHRQVRIEPPSGTPIWRGIASHTQFLAFIDEIRPDLDVDAHPELINWNSNKDTWPQSD